MTFWLRPLSVPVPDRRPVARGVRVADIPIPSWPSTGRYRVLLSMAVCWYRTCTAVSRADSCTRKTSRRPLAPASVSDQFLMTGHSAGVSVDAALIAIVWISAQSIIVTVSCVGVRREWAMDRVVGAVLHGWDRRSFGWLRRVVASHRSISVDWRV